MILRNRWILLLLIILLLCLSYSQLMAWQTINGVAICTAPNNQSFPQITGDGFGGAIITWQDEREWPGHYSIYAQRINSIGSTLWSLEGVAIYTAFFQSSNPRIIGDGSGGAIIVWDDNRNRVNHIYAQRVNSMGSTLWIPDGILVCTASSNHINPKVISDNQGGAIITWEDSRYGNTDIYAQRVSNVGSTLWSLEGIAICTAVDRQSYQNMISDNAGGAIISWQDERENRKSGRINGDIYAQRVSSSGSTLWTLNGVAICTDDYNQEEPEIASDSTGGAIIVWCDHRQIGDFGGWGDVFAQRVNSTGSTLWTNNGVGVYICTECPSGLYYPVITSDNKGGAIVAWYDHRSESGFCHIYAQHVDSNGNVLWDSKGLGICTAANNQFYPRMINDNTGGAIITWQDGRNGINNIYAQHVNSIGSTLWKMNGLAICTAANGQNYPVITNDNSGGAIIAWQESRNGNLDIYAQQVDTNGSIQQFKMKQYIK